MTCLAQDASLLPPALTGFVAGRHTRMRRRLGVSPDPLVPYGPLIVTLASAEPASLEILDLAGRRVLARDVGALGPGQHVVHLGDGARIPPGIYMMRLVQGREIRHARAVVLD